MSPIKEMLFELVDQLASQTTGTDFVRTAYELSVRNDAGRNYLFGILDALMWAEKITPREYTMYYDAIMTGHALPRRRK